MYHIKLLIILRYIYQYHSENVESRGIMNKLTRLEQILRYFNWSGGTVHQVNKVLTTVYRYGEYDKPIDILSMNEVQFKQLSTRVQSTDWSRVELRRILNNA